MGAACGAVAVGSPYFYVFLEKEITKGMNRISGKPLKTRDSGTLGVAGILCLFLELCQGNMRTADVNSHRGHKSDPSVAVLIPVVMVLTPLLIILYIMYPWMWNGSKYKFYWYSFLYALGVMPYSLLKVRIKCSGFS